MIRHTIRIVYILFAFALFSCSIKDFEQGEGDMSLTTADFGELCTDATATTYAFRKDSQDSNALPTPLAKTYKFEWASTPDSVYRALAYYCDGDNETIQLQKIALIPCRRIVKTEDVEQIYTDPIEFTSLWLSANGSYINMAFSIKGSATDSDEQKHTIKVVCDSHDENNGKHTYNLTFYHDQGGIPEYYSFPTYLSIPVKECFEPGSEVVININTYKGWIKKTITLP